MLLSSLALILVKKENMAAYEIWVGLGSNIEDRQSYLTAAITKLNLITKKTIIMSSIYETPPWGGVADGPFLNQVVGVLVNSELLIHYCQLQSKYIEHVETLANSWIRLSHALSVQSSQTTPEQFELYIAELVMLYLLLVELDLGRDRSNNAIRWSSRTIDLDLLEMPYRKHKQLFRSPLLTLPHPRLHERQFVLVPWSEVAPQLNLPTFNTSVADLQKSCLPNSEIKLWHAHS